MPFYRVYNSIWAKMELEKKWTPQYRFCQKSGCGPVSETPEDSTSSQPPTSQALTPRSFLEEPLPRPWPKPWLRGLKGLGREEDPPQPGFTFLETNISPSQGAWCLMLFLFQKKKNIISFLDGYLLPKDLPSPCFVADGCSTLAELGFACELDA